MGEKVLMLFIVEFGLMAIFCVVDRNYPLALYAFGGAILNIGVLWGMK